MKNLFRLSVLSAFLLIAFVSQAQVNYGVKGGLNVSTLSGYSKIAETKHKPGFNIGLVGQINLPSNVFIQPELLFSQEGIRGKKDKKFSNRMLNYLQLPVYVGYKLDAGLGLNVIVGVGPYLACGMGGTNKPFKHSMKRFDAGFSAMGGIQFEKVQLTLGYDLGLTDIRKKEMKKEGFSSKLSNRNLKVSLAYLF
jgi:opacity protein-like surface antigen